MRAVCRARRSHRNDGKGAADWRALPPTSCESCELPLSWERIARSPVERWLAICACGLPWAFFPARPECRPENPLAAALGDADGTSIATPPWIRVFQMTSGSPWWLRWRHLPAPCASCSMHATFFAWTKPSREWHAYSALCLACGHATSEYVSAKSSRVRESPVSGSDWSPPCVAVARLRRAVFSLPLD